MEQKETKNDNMETDDIDPLIRIKECIRLKKSMKFECIDGLSFLMFTISLMEEELAIDIIINGIDYDINESWDNGQTPLHVACQMELENLINIIFKYCYNKINIYSITNDFLLHFTRWESGGKTILHYAAIQNNINICKSILCFEYDIILKQKSIPKLLFIEDFQSNDVIDTALIYNNFQCAKWLYCEKIKYINKHNNNNKHNLIKNNNEIDNYLKNKMLSF
eukprot:389868_1